MLFDPIAADVDRRYEHCCHSRRQRRTQQRWSPYPALAGRPIAELRRILATTGPEHNPVVADLLRAHQSGDDDATTVLLKALIPFVHTDPWITVHGADTADRWAAIARQLATTNPAHAHTVGRRPFLQLLVGRMRRDAARLRVVPDHHVTPYPTVHPHPTSPSGVEDQALARLELSTIAAHLRAGTVDLARWQQLVDQRIHGRTNRAAHSTIGRTGQRLAQLTGRVA